MNKRLLTLLIFCTAALVSSTSFGQTGGPDTFGYSFEPTTFDWVPLANEAGATAHNTGDDGVAVVTLPWTFSWYGVDYTDISIGTNGGISFGAATSLTFANSCLPSSPLSFGAPDLMIFWDDMNQVSGGNVYSWDDVAGGRFIVSWEDVPRYFSVGAGSFQAHFYPGGAVEFHWQDTDFGNPLYDNGASATVGIQDMAGGTGVSGNWLEWSCNTASIIDGTAASFSSCTDADGDGAGDPVCGGDDCDDNDPTVYPGALELCDGLDTDCDPLTSETVDFDGDGETACEGDCDDTDSANSSLLPEVCDGQDNDCNGTADADVGGEIDGDTDGVLSCEDCDDTDAAVFPGALEICNGLDDDCDPATDETVDNDTDGVSACGPDGVANTADDDCNDGEATIYPGAPELCDDLDNDCDGLVSAEELDDDGDGLTECDGDCDDTDSAVLPGAVEVCNAGTDDDCDASTDETVDFDGDGVSACGPDGIADTADDDCNDGEATVFPGATELCDGLDNDCDELMLGGGSQVVASLTTTMAAGNGSSGNVFDLVAINDLSITSFDINATSALAGTIDVYTMTGTSIGNHQTAALWTLHETVAVIGNGMGVPTPVPLATPIDLVAGGTYGIYIHSSLGVQYTNGTTLGALYTSDANLEFYEGYGMGAPAFGTNFSPRVWNGTIHYGDGVNLEGDGDGDGYVECFPWLGVDPGVLDGDDCDDGADTIYPGAPELCDGEDTDCDPSTDENVDVDGDLDTLCDGDCDETDPTIGPSQTEIGCDGIDNDCDPVSLDDGDVDGDGVEICLGDCDDSDPLAYPGAPEICGDGIDQDCDLSDFVVDVDGDGYSDSACGGDDCDDLISTISPAEVEVLCDGVDNDCDPLTLNENDVDTDGVTDCGPDGVFGTADDDCDDSDATNFPGNTEICGDGFDQDCDLSDLVVDVDGDGYSDSACGGEDCDDTTSAISPIGVEVLCDGVDNDCDPLTLNENDVDTDGVSDCGPDGIFGTADDDCDDNDATNFPGNTEACDAQDNDCDGLALPDEVDGDGDGEMICAGDCDDANPANFAAGTEVCDGADNDCDGQANFDPAMEMDFDGDGWLSCEDCADNAVENFPGNIEICDGLDNDCNGLADFFGQSLGDDDDSAGDDDDSAGDDDDSAGDDDDSAGDDDDSASARDDEGPADELDTDGDGFLDCDDDCDDADAAVNPLAEEVCDGIDQDCDGVVPADESDDDGDGMRICDGDCDDGDPATYNGAPEVCDGIDNDCDDAIDDEELDTDGDGYSPCDGDCDDTTADSNPEAEEICDGLDNDCDEALPTEESDADGDGFLLCADDCDDADDTISPDAVEDSVAACDDELDNDCDGLTDVDDEDCDGFITDGPVDSSDCDCSVASEGGSAGLGVLVLGLLGLVRRRRASSLG